MSGREGFLVFSIVFMGLILLLTLPDGTTVHKKYPNYATLGGAVVYYRTSLCFAYSGSGSTNVLTNVPCTDKVLSAIKDE